MDEPSAPEWVVWESETSGGIVMTDGRTITVHYGDELLIRETEGGFIVLQHQPRTVH